MDFPDEIASDESAWATYIPARRPEFKVHRTRGLANSAMGQRGLSEAYALYELVGGTWIKRYENAPAKQCDFCKGDFWVDNAWGGRRELRYHSLGAKTKWNASIICSKCHGIEAAQQRREYEQKNDLAELARLQAKYNKGV